MIWTDKQDKLGERPSRPQSPGVSPGDDGDRARRALAAGETPALRVIGLPQLVVAE